METWKKIFRLTYISAFAVLLSCNPKMGGVVVQQPQLSSKTGIFSESERIAHGLESLSSSVYKLTVVVFYEVYTFAEESHLKRTDLSNLKLRKTAVSHEIINRSVLGTVIPVYYSGSTAGFLTCAHVVAFPDTAFSYYKSDNNSRFVKSVGVKVKQQNYLSELHGTASVIASDAEHDISFLKMEIKPGDPTPELMPFMRGSTKNMNWGTRIYVLGYPQGKKMVTSALYSKSGLVDSGHFLMDAVLNKGYSGAPVVEYSNQPPYFKWIGMASSIASESFNYLSPDMTKQTHFSPSEPYKGVIKVDAAKFISYGISYSVSIEQIRKFIHQSKNELEEEGIGPIDW